MSDQLTPAQRELLQRVVALGSVFCPEGEEDLNAAYGLVSMYALTWDTFGARLAATPAGRALLEVEELRRSRDAWREVAEGLRAAMCDAIYCDVCEARSGCDALKPIKRFRALAEKEPQPKPLDTRSAVFYAAPRKEG